MLTYFCLLQLWDVKTTECVSVFHPGNSHNEIPVHAIHLMPRNTEQIVVCNRSSTLYVMNVKGQAIKTFTHGKKEERTDFVCAMVSPKGEFLYGVTEDKTLYCFSILVRLSVSSRRACSLFVESIFYYYYFFFSFQSGEIVHSIPNVHDREVIGIHHHPHRNLVLTHADDGLVKLWSP
jgi:WD40 repeat-containing protein SMU1